MGEKQIDPSLRQTEASKCWAIRRQKKQEDCVRGRHSVARAGLN